MADSKRENEKQGQKERRRKSDGQRRREIYKKVSEREGKVRKRE